MAMLQTAYRKISVFLALLCAISVFFAPSASLAVSASSSGGGSSSSASFVISSSTLTQSSGSLTAANVSPLVEGFVDPGTKNYSIWKIDYVSFSNYTQRT